MEIANWKQTGRRDEAAAVSIALEGDIREFDVVVAACWAGR